MGKWSKSLPEPLGEPYTDRASNVLHAISFAMDENFPAELRADEVRRAAADVRAWRKSFGGWSVRLDDATWADTVRFCLRLAARCVLWADGDTGRIRTREEYLRRAEAYLREAASLLDAEDPK